MSWSLHCVMIRIASSRKVTTIKNLPIAGRYLFHSIQSEAPSITSPDIIQAQLSNSHQGFITAVFEGTWHRGREVGNTYGFTGSA